MVGWRKARQGSNYVKGTKVLQIRPKYKINTVIGYTVELYDFSKFVSIPKGRVLKIFKNKSDAIKFRQEYMRRN
jgi:hypothetical protein